MCLGCKSVVCLHDHTHWLNKLYAMVLFVMFEEQKTHPYNQQLLGSRDVEGVAPSTSLK